MMITRLKQLTLVLLFFFGGFIVACDDESPCYCGDVLPFFEINGLNAVPNELSGDQFEEVEPGASLEWEDYRLLTRFEVDYFTATKHDHSRRPGWSALAPAAWACSCQEAGYKGSSEGIAELFVLAETAFRPGVQPQDTISELFVLTDTQGNQEMDLAEFVTLYGETVYPQLFFLQFREDPEADAPFAARLVVELGNGEVHEATVDSVILE